MKLRSVFFDRPRPHPERVNLPAAYLTTEGSGPFRVESLTYEDGFVWAGRVGYPVAWCRIEREPYDFEREPERESEPELVLEPIPQKKRGRPRKYPLPDSAA